MTTDSSSTAPDDGFWSRLLMRMGHVNDRFGIALWAALPVTLLASTLVDTGIAHVVLDVLTWAVMSVYLAVAVGGVKHSRNLCLRCVVSAGPLLDNPQAAAGRRARELRLFHRRRLTASIMIGGMTVWWLAGTVLISLARHWAPTPRTLAHMGATLLVALSITACCGCLHVLRTHMKLQPWCPLCRRPDDGDDEQAPVPDPEPAGTITR